jgi:hypothetical protein
MPLARAFAGSDHAGFPVTMPDGTQGFAPAVVSVDQAGSVLSGTTPSYEDQRVFDGFGFTTSTNIVAVPANNYLLTELANPAGSGVNFVMTVRSFSDNIVGGNAPLEYLRYANMSYLPAGTATTVAVNNRLGGGAAPPTGTTFRYMTGTGLPVTTNGGSTLAASTSAGFVPTNGEELRIKDIVLIAPGQRLVYAVGGSGGGLATTARIKSTLLFYTRPI